MSDTNGHSAELTEDTLRTMAVQLTRLTLAGRLRNNGIQITHTPFNGQRLPRILGMDMRA